MKFFWNTKVHGVKMSGIYFHKILIGKYDHEFMVHYGISLWFK